MTLSTQQPNIKASTALFKKIVNLQESERQKAEAIVEKQFQRRMLAISLQQEQDLTEVASFRPVQVVSLDPTSQAYLNMQESGRSGENDESCTECYDETILEDERMIHHTNYIYQ